jgi:hypothetical protein
MKTVEARVLSVLKLQPRRLRNGSAAQNEDPIPAVWRMCLSYPGGHTVFEVELHEPLKSLASKKYTIGLNGMVEFDMFSKPPVAADERIQIDLFDCGEKILLKDKINPRKE